MKYTSLHQLFEDKQRVFETLKRTVAPLSSSQSVYRLAHGQWNIAEVVEHLVLVESRLLRLINVSLNKLEKAGYPSEQPVGFEVEIPDGVEKNNFFKVKTKEEYEPMGQVSIEDSIKKLKEIHQALFSFQERLGRVELSAISFDHWLFGSLTIGQWLAFIGIHEQRHLEQIQSILSAATFPSH